jgi:hypothetical protein
VTTIDPHDVDTDPAIDVSAALAELTRQGVAVSTEHTGGGNWVAGIGPRGEWDEDQSLYRHALNLGPFYRGDAGEPSFVGYAGDLYAVIDAGQVPGYAAQVSETITSADHLRSILSAVASRLV